MTAPRLIGTLSVKDGIVVQSVGFKKFLPVGSPTIAAEYLNTWGIDEIVLLDLRASCEDRSIASELIEAVAEKCFVPLAVGGGIRSVDEMRRCFNAGADKVIINSAAFADPALVRRGANMFGCQAIVVSIDYRREADGSLQVYTHGGSKPINMSPFTAAVFVQAHGAGEIMLRCIDHDGARIGYDRKTLCEVAAAARVPVIACGGAGHPEHLFEVLTQPGVLAAAAGNFLHYTEHSVAHLKSYLQKRGLPVRQTAYVNYDGHGFDAAGRLARRSDQELMALRFQHFAKEVI